MAKGVIVGNALILFGGFDRRYNSSTDNIFKITDLDEPNSLLMENQSSSLLEGITSKHTRTILWPETVKAIWPVLTLQQTHGQRSQ